MDLAAEDSNTQVRGRNRERPVAQALSWERHSPEWRVDVRQSGDWRSQGRVSTICPLNCVKDQKSGSDIQSRLFTAISLIHVCRLGNNQALQSAVFFVAAKADMDGTQREAICGTP
jgi:hypothetical protein